jgi:hypothetical protein
VRSKSVLASLVGFAAVIWLALPVAVAAAPKAKTGRKVLRLPYDRTQAYHIQLMPGSPFRVDLPDGETVRNTWFDRKWWSAEGGPGSPLLIIRTSDSRGDIPMSAMFSVLHVETQPSLLLITFTLERVDEDAITAAPQIPVAMELYLEGPSAIEHATRAKVNDAVAKEMPYLEREVEEKASAKYAEMYRRAVTNLRDDYEWAGDFADVISKVIDDRVRTTINLKKASEKVVVLFEDKDGKRHPVNCEVESGMYIIQKVLRPGQKFRLVLGKEESWVALK